MPGTESSVEVEVTPDRLYRLIVDFEAYPDFIEEMVEAEILEQSGEVYTVRFVAQMIKRVEYVLRLTGHPGRELTWELVEGFFRSNDGGWILEPSSEGTRATYWIDVDIGPLVPRRILNRLAGTNLPQTLAAFKAEAERRGQDGP